MQLGTGKPIIIMRASMSDVQLPSSRFVRFIGRLTMGSFFAFP